MNTLTKNPTYTSHRRGDATRLLVIEEQPRISSLGQIERELRAGDLIVVNESGTMPASFAARLERTGESMEVRLAVREGAADQWLAVALGEGSWRQRTEDRPPPPALHAGDFLLLGKGLRAKVRRTDGRHEQLVHLRLFGDFSAILSAGKPVQYSYHRDPLTLWDAQTAFAGPPWSVEAPSSLFPLTSARLMALRRSHRVVSLLHGAGLSSMGEAALDALLPLPEPYRVPEETLQAIRETKQAGARVLAWGTSVARALEQAFESGQATGVASLRLGPDRPARLVDGLITGLHDQGTSHYQLERAFVPLAWLERANEAGAAARLLTHEYGDLALLWRQFPTGQALRPVLD